MIVDSKSSRVSDGARGAKQYVEPGDVNRDVIRRYPVNKCQ